MPPGGPSGAVSRRRRRRATPLVTAGLALGLAACGSGGTAPAGAPVPAGLPQAQAVPGSGGTWATLAMGHVDDPLNTFGELFYRPSCSGTAGCTGGTAWALATPPGVASNGGIMVASNPAGGVTAGFGVSLALRFSPLAESTDAGAVWTGGILPVALAAQPDALAASGPTQRLALSAAPPLGPGGVYATSTDLTRWTHLATLGTVTAAASSSGCTLRALTAVAVTAAGDDLVAGDCTGGDHVAVARVGAAGGPTATTMVGPQVPTVRNGPVRVLRMASSTTGVAVLVQVGTPGRTTLYEATAPEGTSSWTFSPPFATDRPVVATAVAPASGFVVLLGAAGSGGAPSALALVGPGVPWHTPPAPPSGTAVVAASDDGSLDALVPSGVVLDVYRLGADRWSQVQQLAVPIQYGSTSAGGATG